VKSDRELRENFDTPIDIAALLSTINCVDAGLTNSARRKFERRADHIATGLHLALGMIATDARQLTLIAYNRERDADGPGGTPRKCRG